MALSKHKIISFDIFDTLLERNVFNPSDIFHLMSHKIEYFLGIRNFDFLTIRKLAEKRAYEYSRDYSVEEITLDEIYHQFQILTGFENEVVNKIKNLEVDFELRYLKTKPIGMNLLHEALLLEKDIILISDTYFNKETILKFLQKHNINISSDKIFLSSEIRYKKHNGLIYPIILEKLGVPAKHILHIGDNYVADNLNSKKYGMDSIHVFNKKEEYMDSLLYKTIYKSTHEASHINHNYMHALLATTNHKNNKEIFRHVEDVASLGFAPLLIGFVQWIIQSSISDGVEDLFFLARDGKVMKQAYDILSPYYKNAPRSHYLLASRKACNTTKLKNFYEIFNILKIPYTNAKLEDLFYQRFSLLPINYEKVIEKYGFNKDSLVSQAKDNETIISILKELQQVIFQVAEEEKKLYLGYLHESGLPTPTKSAVVDIGYMGTMQSALSEILNQPLGGYYLITFYESLDKVAKYGNKIEGYLDNFDNRINSSNVIIKKIPLYETFFSSEDCSFLNFKEDEGKVVPIYQEPDSHEQLRVGFLHKVHNKALDSVKQFAEMFNEDLPNIYFDPSIAVLSLDNFLNNQKARKLILEGIYFEDKYTGAVLSNVQNYYQEIKFNPLNKIVFNIMMKSLSHNKARKLKNNTAKFFLESKDKRVRLLGKYIFGVKL